MADPDLAGIVAGLRRIADALDAHRRAGEPPPAATLHAAAGHLGYLIAELIDAAPGAAVAVTVTPGDERNDPTAT